MDQIGWDTQTFEMVDWNLTGVYMKTIKDTQRTNVVTFLYNWHNTGIQNIHFQDSKATNPDANKSYKDAHTKYPFNYGAVETPSTTCTVLQILQKDPHLTYPEALKPPSNVNILQCQYMPLSCAT